MIQCKDCEFYEQNEQGQRIFRCDPFNNIVEPECLQKWQLMRLDMLVASYRNMLGWYEKMAPMQNKIFKYVQREINEMDESEGWKFDSEDSLDDPDNEEPFI